MLSPLGPRNEGRSASGCSPDLADAALPSAAARASLRPPRGRIKLRDAAEPADGSLEFRVDARGLGEV